MLDPTTRLEPASSHFNKPTNEQGLIDRLTLELKIVDKRLFLGNREASLPLFDRAPVVTRRLGWCTCLGGDSHDTRLGFARGSLFRPYGSHRVVASMLIVVRGEGGGKRVVVRVEEGTIFSASR